MEVVNICLYLHWILIDLECIFYFCFLVVILECLAHVLDLGNLILNQHIFPPWNSAGTLECPSAFIFAII
jgi:hypothetical protein